MNLLARHIGPAHQSLGLFTSMTDTATPCGRDILLRSIKGSVLVHSLGERNRIAIKRARRDGNKEELSKGRKDR